MQIEWLRDASEMKLSPPKLDVLVIAPHPDDAELGMGGAILKILSEGMRVGILDLTNGEPTPMGSEEIRGAETRKASEILGVTWRGNLGLPNRSLEPTLTARKDLASVFRLCQAPWLFAPYWDDAHPDHVAALRLIEDARFWAKLSKTDMPGERFHPTRIYNYYCVHLKLVAQPAFILNIDSFWPAKRDAILAFQSQFVHGKESDSPSFIDNVEVNALYWGQMIGAKYGEPFNCKEPIGLKSLSSLV